ncbi:MAG: dephospho-CoA kinase, partial [Acidobacteria bacterium]
AIVAEIEIRVATIDGDVVVEIPLLRMNFPGRWLRIAVVADKDVRIDRAVQRGGDRADVERRVAAQVSDEEWMRWADVVIDNNGDPEQAADRVRAIVDEMVP